MSREDEESPGFVIVHEELGFLTDWFIPAEVALACDPIELHNFFEYDQPGFTKPWSKYHPPHARIFTSCESAERALQRARRYTMSVAIMPLRWTDEFWEGQDDAGEPRACRCEECESIGNQLCEHRRARWCWTCREVRPARFFEFSEEFCDGCWCARANKTVQELSEESA